MSEQQPLLGHQKKFLRGKAHSLEPKVHVGAEGVSDAVIAQVIQVFRTHELIKVRLREPDDKKGMALALAERTGSHLCGLVGHTVILYRPDPEEPKIQLPEARSADGA